MKNWKKDSWKDCTIKHVPPYKDQEKLDKIIARLNTFPPLVFAGECNNLKAQLAKATERKAFLAFLQEIQDDLNPEITETDAVEMLVSAKEDRPATDGRGRIERLGQLVGGQ